MQKTYIDANQLLLDSYELGLMVLESGFRPDYIVGVWRGGAPVGIAIQELLKYGGLDTDHIAIRTSHYTGIEQTSDSVIVHGLHYLIEHVNAEDNVLIVDDVFDSGRSIQQVILDLEKKCRRNTPVFRIATPYFKPANNKTSLAPDFYLHESDEWLVFPHELEGLSAREVLEEKPGLGRIRQRLVALHQG
ncbi:hypoxanthine phosphoribosyltransferase [Seongchinamella sediminis]|uniref:Hypoxanthine phosphoribosyltransferase n=1 Tax=Seongchinamella sediminis TaxID=2283635 RepID=A0A3L7DVH4_9GAMM|nr:phosphoribosyltransferase family protein [Seongchinamella sediminis]RLQ21568.1 hypoxanthine phosphoribosyltransferase [Seongchinamella sediminis]